MSKGPLDYICEWLEDAWKWCCNTFDSLPGPIQFILKLGYAGVKGALTGNSKCDITKMGENMKKMWEATPALVRIADEYQRAVDDKKFSGTFNEFLDGGYTYHNMDPGGYDYTSPTLRDTGKGEFGYYHNILHMPLDFNYGDALKEVDKWNEEHPDQKIEIDGASIKELQKEQKVAQRNKDYWYHYVLDDKQKQLYNDCSFGDDSNLKNFDPNFPVFDPNHDYYAEYHKPFDDYKPGTDDVTAQGGVVNPSAISETPDLDKYSYGS